MLATDRAGAVNSLKAVLDMLQRDLNEYREMVKAVDVTDLAGIYVVGGRSSHRALQIAKGDLKGLEGSMQEVEDKMKQIRADVRYGFEVDK